MEDNKLLFLTASYLDNINYYENVLKWGTNFWDIIVITASNENQKNAYEMEINERKKRNYLPNIPILIIIDPDQLRVGSGGATLNALKVLKEKYSNDVFSKKILLIHSGGDSKRIPQYSSCGKLFSPIPKVNKNFYVQTIFDEILVNYAMIANRIKSGMIITSGDVEILFNPLQIDITSEDAVAISVKAGKHTGEHHGVFISDNHNILKEFAHKKSIKELEEKNAIDQSDLVDIDTGIFYLSESVLNSMLSLLGKDNEYYKEFISEELELNFYGDFIYPFSKNGSLEEYLSIGAEKQINDAVINARKKIWNIFNKYSLKVSKVSPAKFLHCGTSKELKDLFNNANNYVNLNWNKIIISNYNKNNSSILNSIIDDNAIMKDNSFIEYSTIDKKAVIGNNTIISNSYINCDIPDNVVLNTLTLNNEYVTRIFGINDNPKEIDILFGLSITNTLTKYLSKDTIWNNKNESLWFANIYSVCKTKEESIKCALILYKIFFGLVSSKEITEWIKTKKMNMKDSYELCNIKAMIENNNKLRNNILANNLLNEFIIGNNINKLLDVIENKKEIFEFIKNSKVNNNKLYKKYALLYLINKDRNFDEINYEDLCYKEINNLIKSHNSCLYDKNYDINRDNAKISSPVRVNFGGGWSDTPPYCLENGGTVLNAAIDLNGKLPIEVSARIIKDNKKSIYVISKDLNVSNTLDLTSIDEEISIEDSFGLIKASLKVLNIKKIMEENNISLEIITSVDVPKGSGLGTSSIIAGTILKTLIKIFNLNVKEEELFTYVLYVEQLISAGGGWQDQIGGLTNGIKIIETNALIKQDFKITYLNNDDNINELNKRLVLIFSGQRRIAKHLLRTIMNKYINNEPEAIDILKKIQKIALLQKFELEKGSLKEFCKLVNEHYNLIKILDPDVENSCIKHIIYSIDDYIEACTIAGAGGGGFIIAILKEGKSKEEIEKHLHNIYADSGVLVASCSIIN